LFPLKGERKIAPFVGTFSRPQRGKLLLSSALSSFCMKEEIAPLKTITTI